MRQEKAAKQANQEFAMFLKPTEKHISWKGAVNRSKCHSEVRKGEVLWTVGSDSGQRGYSRWERTPG